MLYKPFVRYLLRPPMSNDIFYLYVVSYLLGSDNEVTGSPINRLLFSFFILLSWFTLCAPACRIQTQISQRMSSWFYWELVKWVCWAGEDWLVDTENQDSELWCSRQRRVVSDWKLSWTESNHVSFTFRETFICVLWRIIVLCSKCKQCGSVVLIFLNKEEHQPYRWICTFNWTNLWDKYLTGGGFNATTQEPFLKTTKMVKNC